MTSANVMSAGGVVLQPTAYTMTSNPRTFASPATYSNVNKPGGIYQPENTTFVFPGTQLKSGMYPLYEMDAVPTFEAPIMWNASRNFYSSEIPGAIIKERHVSTSSSSSSSGEIEQFTSPQKQSRGCCGSRKEASVVYKKKSTGCCNGQSKAPATNNKPRKACCGNRGSANHPSKVPRSRCGGHRDPTTTSLDHKTRAVSSSSSSYSK